jgi:hypothetical protein
MIDSFLSSLVLLLGLAMLRYVWRRQRPIDRWLKYFAWLAIMVSLVIAGSAANREFQVVYLLVLLSFMAMTMVWFNRQSQPALASRPSSTALKKQPFQWRNNSAVMVNCVLTCAVSSCLVSLLIAHSIDGEIANQMVVAAMAYPLLWALSIIAVCLVRRQWLFFLSQSVVSIAILGVLL